MMKSKVLITIALLAGALAAKAQELNTANLPAPAPVLNAGWNYDQVDVVAQNSEDSPYVYNITSPEEFTITDAFVAGDNYFVYDNGILILTTTVPGGPGTPTSNPATAYADGGFSEGSVLLGDGSHSLTIQSDLGAGLGAAGFYDRLDSVSAPDGGLTAGLLSLGMLALGFVRRSIK